MTFSELPEGARVMLCPEVAADLRRASMVAADLDRTCSVWCGACRFESAQAGRLADLLKVWPMLAVQEVPEMGQMYERDESGQWMLREKLT
ncbi:hypothetical protein [Sagittula salina]|uniref:Uncharacterized protein n=1 Tax=Sagittula salina TaxID=2820268 RepID=A0A940MS01_9RHOB|nr:hypothetical protein [Sagittula salina]MBP0481934.1 hypothetical protein [Sagittula salina]